MLKLFLSEVSQSINTCVINILIFSFFNKVYGKKYQSRILYGVAYIGAVTAMILVNQIQIAPINLLYTIVYMDVLSVWLFRADFKKFWLYNLIFLLILFFSDAITFSFWSAIRGDSYGEIILQEELTAISNLLNILVMFLGYKIVLAFLCKNDVKVVQKQELIFLISMATFECFVIYHFMSKVSCTNDGIAILLILFGFLIVNVYITYMIEQISIAYQYKYELSLSQKQNEIQLTHYQNLEEKYQQSRKVIHDLKKHFSVLAELEHINNESATAYGSLIEHEMNDLFCGFRCSNRILSIILSQKLEIAQKEQIEVDLKVDDISLDFLNDLDITALFANLWDNAIEACAKLAPDRRHILFVMQKVNGFLVINMENPFDSVVPEGKQKFRSTKENHMGLGLSILRSTVEKYDGLLVTEQNNFIFLVEVTIPIP